PLELLAAPIVQGVSQPVLVMQQDRDPHHLALRPSERLALDRAELLLWTGPMLELPLQRVVRELGAGKVLTVQELDGLHLLQVDGELDPHVWLDTRNARVIANAL